MANTVELNSRDHAGGIDPNDPLMELSRIIGVVPVSTASARTEARDPQLSIEDSFALDLEQELSDAAPDVDPEVDFGTFDSFESELGNALNLGAAAPSIEPSLEDELSALLSEEEPTAAQDVEFEFDGDDFALDLPEEPADLPEREMELAAGEVADFDADLWLDDPIPLSASDDAAELAVDEPVEPSHDPVFEQMFQIPVEPLKSADPEFQPAFEPQLEFEPQNETGFDPEFASLTENDLAPAIEAEAFDVEVEAPDFDAAPVAAAFKPEQELERLIARTAPQPVVDSIAEYNDPVEVVDEFDIPDFEFEAEPEVAAVQDFDFDDVYDEQPSVQPEPVSSHFPSEQTAAPADPDFDFDALLDQELGQAADDQTTSNSYGGALLGAGVAAAAQARSGPAMSGPEPDLDIFRPDLAEHTYGSEPAGQRKAPWLAAAALAAVVVVGGGSWWALSGPSTSTPEAGPVLVKADPEPVKVAPENPGGQAVANQDKAVYDKVSGEQEALPSGGQLVSESEEPLDIASATPAETPAGKSEARVDPQAAAEAPSGQAADTLAIAPKKVKTFIVKPDGTMVERPAEVALAPAVAEPVAPAAPEVAKAAAPVAPEPAPVEAAAAAPVTAPAETVAAAPAEPANAPVAEQAAEPAIKVVKTKKIKAPVEQKPAAEATAPAAVAEAGPVGERPADQPVTIVGQTGGQNAGGEQQVASVDPAPQAGAGGYTIQIASTPSPEAAKSTYAALSRKYGGVISGRGVNIQKADVEGKGTVYRVRIPAGSKQEANALCAQYKSAGGSCFVSK